MRAFSCGHLRNLAIIGAHRLRARRRDQKPHRQRRHRRIRLQVYRQNQLTLATLEFVDTRPGPAPEPQRSLVQCRAAGAASSRGQPNPPGRDPAVCTCPMARPGAIGSLR